MIKIFENNHYNNKPKFILQNDKGQRLPFESFEKLFAQTVYAIETGLSGEDLEYYQYISSYDSFVEMKNQFKIEHPEWFI